MLDFQVFRLKIIKLEKRRVGGPAYMQAACSHAGSPRILHNRVSEIHQPGAAILNLQLSILSLLSTCRLAVANRLCYPATFS